MQTVLNPSNIFRSDTFQGPCFFPITSNMKASFSYASQSICTPVNMHDTSVSNHSSHNPLITPLSSSPLFISLPRPNVQSFIPSPPLLSHHSGKSSKDLVEDKNSVTSIYSLMKECLYHNTEYVRSPDIREENKRSGTRDRFRQMRRFGHGET